MMKTEFSFDQMSKMTFSASSPKESKLKFLFLKGAMLKPFPLEYDYKI